MTIPRIALLPVAVGGLLAAASSAQAALSTVTSVPFVDTLGSFPGVPTAAPVGSLNAGPTPEPNGFSTDFNGNTLTFTTSTGAFEVDGNDIGFTNENPSTGAPIFAPGYGILDNSAGTTGTAPITDTITFGTPVTEFGLDAFSLDGGQNFDFTVNTNDLAPVTYSIDNDPAALTDPAYSFDSTPDDRPVFFGVQATGGTTITSLTISSPNASASGFVIGTAVPEPAPLALLALGLLPVGLTLAVRRRRAA